MMKRPIRIHDLDRVALGQELLRQGMRELARLRLVRGAHRRTAQRIRRALAVVALAASLLGLPLTGSAEAATPAFGNHFGSVSSLAAPELADIDGDGDLDAFVGEGSGNTVFFANTGTAATPAFGAAQTNPFGLADVGSFAAPELADIDGDGDLDAFIGNSAGDTIFFANTGTAAAPAFAGPQTNPFGLADVGSDAAPALADIDGDGDLDAFVGELHGDTIFFANTGTAAAPAFAGPQTNPFGLADVGSYAALALADIDGDGDLDAFIGNFEGNTIFFVNTGTGASPAFAGPQTNPFGLIDVGGFAAPELADIDGDGDLDAFIGVFFGNTIFFENTGTAAAPAFAPAVRTNPFGLAYAGFDIVPALADIDGDGDLDAFIGNSSGYTIFFENTGTAAAPAFGAAQSNPFGLADVGRRAAPELADIDGDGDLDSFIGEDYGNTIFFANTGTATAPAFAARQTNPFGLARVGFFAAPELADIDGDGDLDALVGEDFYGNTIFFANTGTQTAPAFAAPQTNPFGLAGVGSRSRPAFADIDGDGDLDALIGSDSGNTIFFENTGTAMAPAFAAAQTNPFGLATVGLFGGPAPELADIDGDGDLDVFIGHDYETIFFENIAASGPLVFDRASDTVGAGGTVTTDTEADGATASDVVETTVTTPNAGTIEISERAVTMPNPLGFTLFGQQVSIEAPTATAPDPLVIVFELDESILPPGEDETTIAVFRDGTAVGACAGAPGEADPDPCVSSRVLRGDGDVELTVLTSQASEWNFGASEDEPVDGCPVAPDPGCVTGFEKGSLLVNEKKSGKEKLVVKLVKGPALAQSDFGNPLDPGGTAYQLCLYDDENELVAELEVDRAGELCGTKPCWKSIGAAPPAGKGFAYKDKATSSDGVLVMSAKGGTAGKTKLAVKAANNAGKGQTSLPVGIAPALAATASATVQVRASDAECLSATLTDVVKQDATLFKAK